MPDEWTRCFNNSASPVNQPREAHSDKSHTNKRTAGEQLPHCVKTFFQQSPGQKPSAR